MFGKAFTLGRIRGIAIRVDVSWFLIAALVTWSFYARFTVVETERSATAALVMAVVGALLFFGSILVHELAHALEAQHRDVTVAGITLFVFGGVTESRFDVRRPVDEFALTAVGPFSSFVLAAVFGLLASAADAAGLDATDDVLGLVGWINVALGVFNLLPGAPLDGGRLLRSGIWWVTKDRRRATVVAARAGQVLGTILVALGVLQFLFVAGGIGGLWLAVIGWFLLQAARAELARADMEELLEGRLVRSLLPSGQDALPRHLDLAEAVDSFIAPREADTFLVHDESGTPVGILGLEEVKAVPRDRRAEVSVGEAMRDLEGIPRIAADDPGTEVLDRLAETGAVLVTDGDAVIGVLTVGRMGVLLQRLTWLERERAGTGR